MKIKLTDEDGKTRYGTKWRVGKTIRTDKNSVLYYYEDLILGIMIIPKLEWLPYNNRYCRAFEVEGKEVFKDNLKRYSKKLKVIKELNFPEITIEQKAKFGILCALEVCKNLEWQTWAHDWINGSDRTHLSASTAAYTIRKSEANTAGAYAARAAAIDAAEGATRSASYTTELHRRSIVNGSCTEDDLFHSKIRKCVDVSDYNCADAHVGGTAARAAYAAAYSPDYPNSDFIALAHKAMQ